MIVVVVFSTDPVEPSSSQTSSDSLTIQLSVCGNNKKTTVVREIFVVKNFRTHACVRKLNVRNFSSQYIKYGC